MYQYLSFNSIFLAHRDVFCQARCMLEDIIKTNLIEIHRKGVELSQVLLKGKNSWKTYVYMGR